MRYLHLHRQPATVLDSLAADPSPRVRYRLAWALAPQAQSLDAEFFRTFLQNANDPWEKHAIYAVLSRVPAMKESFPEAFRKAPSVAKKESLPTPKATPATSVSRAEAWNQFSPALTLTGNANKGRTIYQERCASCHRLNNEGTAVGPDLESVRTAGKETTLINILDPNREVPPRFATVEVSTTDDEIVSGVVANDAANGLTLKLANGVESFIPRTKIKSTRTTSISLMPEGLESGLTPADLADLLAYIAGE
jgi:putative heme-binding domain-containing protein